jgi:DUF4097 and DUF4098 domain-containing protein YvlB
MESRTLWRVRAGLPVLLVAFAVIGIHRAGNAQSDPLDVVEKSFSVDGRPHIELKNVDGRTRISGGTETGVRVRAVKEVRRVSNAEEARLAAERVEIMMEQIGNRIILEARYPNRHFSFGREPSVLVHFEVYLPRAADVTAKNVDGPMDVDNLEGNLELGTVDGNLKATRCAGRIEAQSVDGDVLLDEVTGDVNAQTVDGDLTIDGTLEVLAAKSTDGSIQARVQPGSRVSREWSIRTVDGSITLGVPEGLAADLEINTSDGHIKVDHPLTAGGRVSDQRLEGKLYGGGQPLRLRASDGNVTLTR